MPIQPGERIPEVVLQRIRDGVEQVDTRTLFDSHRAVLFAVPGAFTPTCRRSICPATSSTSRSSASAASRCTAWRSTTRS